MGKLGNIPLGGMGSRPVGVSKNTFVSEKTSDDREKRGSIDHINLSRPKMRKRAQSSLLKEKFELSDDKFKSQSQKNDKSKDIETQKKNKPSALENNKERFQTEC